MTERDPARFETTHGERAPGSLGERLVVGLGALALVGGIVIAFGNVVKLEPEIASESPTAAPTAGATRTPRPTPTPRQPRVVTLDDRPPDADLERGHWWFYGWIRPRTDLVLRAQPDHDAAEIGTLAAGDIAFAETSEPGTVDGWLSVSVEGRYGWVATIRDGEDLVGRFAEEPQATSGQLWRLAAGAEGFLAIGMEPQRVQASPQQVLGRSSDGRTWEAVRFDPRWGQLVSVAWGPIGWMLATVPNDRNQPAAAIWSSQDGATWEYLGRMPTSAGAWPNDLVATDFGYLLVSQTQNGGTELWFSADGVTWHESQMTGAQPAFAQQGFLQVAATPMGFYAWDATPRLPGYGSPPIDGGAFSASGTTWTPVSEGPGGQALHVTAVGREMLAIDADPEGGATRVWRGDTVDGALELRRMPDEDVGFRGARVTALAADGERVVALGIGRTTERPMAWVTDGVGWVTVDLPADFRGIPHVSTGGGGTTVVVGSRPNLRGANPLIWAFGPDGSWQAEARPLIEDLPDPRAEDCPAAPREALELLALDPAVAVSCFSRVPITVQAWSASCDGCWGPGPGTSPDWLSQPTDNQLFLSPIETEIGYWWSPAILHPPLTAEASWINAWVEITGHFDDPAAKDCRSAPGFEHLPYYEGREAMITYCRQQFVVTSVTVVDEPEG